MWQRIQTLYLLLTILIQWSSLYIPLRYYTDGDRVGKGFYLLGDVATSQSIILSVVVTLTAILAILKFKNRKQQMQCCTLLIIETFATFITTLISAWIFVQEQPTTPNFYYAYLLLPIVTIALPVLAKRAIRKDDELVRSSNRLR